MKSPRPTTQLLCCSTTASIRGKYLSHIGILAALFLLLSEAPTKADAQEFPSGCVGYCGNGIAIGIGVTTGAIAAVGIVLAINHDHHTLIGCVSSSPSGLEVQTSDAKTYSLEGNAVAIKAGDRVKLHGSKTKKTNGSPAVFKVEKLKRDYGPCPAASASTLGSTH
ncbi:MAG: hypothetical protein WBQ95_02640 [Terracidiphilus sp.]